VIGIDSPVEVAPERMLVSFGNNLVGFVVAVNERKSGRAPLSPRGGEADPRSNSSQPYVRASPSGSLAVAVSAKGVFTGIV
jgi:hypothetical protein